MDKRLMDQLAAELGRSPTERGTKRLGKALDRTPPKARPGRWERLGRIVAAGNAVALGIGGATLYAVAARGHGDPTLFIISGVILLAGLTAAVVALRST